MSVRAKFKVSSVTHNEHGQQIVKGMAVGDDGIPENQRYHKFTPSGEISITVDNPAIGDFFKPGHKFYLDFTPAS